LCLWVRPKEQKERPDPVACDPVACGSEALMLPEAERAEFAHALVISLDAPDDADALEAWKKEILRPPSC
jgi:hypothetical protein